MADIQKLVRIQIGIIALFVFFKFIRPRVLESDSPELFKIALLSLPNLLEAIIGILILTGIGLYLNNQLLSCEKQFKRNFIYIIATVIAAIYVITQEFKIHNLGGNNVFDKTDVIFSVAGLFIGYSIVNILKPKIHRSSLEEAEK